MVISRTLSGALFILIPVFCLSVRGQESGGEGSLSHICECQPPCESFSNCQKSVPREDCPCCHMCADEDDSKGGCEHFGIAYEIHSSFYSPNCSEKCQCLGEGKVSCVPTTCSPGLIPKGRIKDDPYCHESDGHPSADVCCVLVLCEAEEESDGGIYYDDEEEIDVGSHDGEEEFTVKEVKAEESQKKNDGSRSGDTNLKFLQITSTTIQVEFPGISGGNLMYVEDRLYKEEPEDRRNNKNGETPWRNAIILEGSKIFTLTGLNAGTVYRIRWQAPDKQYPDLKVFTHEHTEKLPKAIVTKKNYNSATLSFDHFAPENYEHGYVAQYRLKNDPTSKWMLKNVDNHNEGDLPSVTLDDLIPESKYVAKVSIYSDIVNGTFGKSTGEIEFKTDMGCAYQNSSFPIGIFNIGCESSCNCREDGKVDCGDRCAPPLYKSGELSDDPLCVEQFVEGDDCCVVVTCAGNEKGPCQEIKCGNNAECRHEVFRGESAETICVCKEGYTGDPDSESGCSPNPVTVSSTKGSEACVAKNETYVMGEHWFDGCDYKCYCSENLEIFCQPRCKNIPTATAEGCELRTDKEDDCCQVLFCPHPDSTDDDLKPVIVPFDGCIFKNVSYRPKERFYDGCEQQCQCMGYGDKVCLPRCPPTAPAPGQNCVTLKDPSDHCCNITVCDEPVFDPQQNVDKQDVEKTPRIINEDFLTQNIEGLQTDGIDSEFVRNSRILTEGSNRYQDRRFALPVHEGTKYEGIFLGPIQPFHHNVQGSVYALNDSTLFIKNFSYDGQGPDAFFWVGTNSPSPDVSGIIVPYPYIGEDYNQSDAPVLGSFRNEDIMLTLPRGIKAKDLEWISVWCRAFSANFGQLIIPKDFSLKKEIDESPKDESFYYPVNDNHSVKKKNICLFKGQEYIANEVFYDGCDSFCLCLENGETLCNPINCPSDFGLDVINPFCLIWNKHEDFVPKAPMCCPPVPVCESDGTCHYRGYSFRNYDNIPQNLTGCEMSCYCNSGEVKCQEACNELSPDPPSYLRCPPEQAVIKPKEDRPCCNMWACTKLNDLPDIIQGVQVESLNSSTLEISLEVPRALGGRKGFYKVLLGAGSEAHTSPDEWPQKLINPENGVFAVDSEGILKLFVHELVPSQRYFLRVDVHIKTDPNTAISQKVIKTKILSTVMPHMEEIESPKLRIEEINLNLNVDRIEPTSAFVTWRFFTLDEKKFIDGVQIRFNRLENGQMTSPVPITTPFIHRDTNFYHLAELTPHTEYKIDLYLIPVANSTTEYVSIPQGGILFKTLEPRVDPYEFKLRLDVEDSGDRWVRLAWSGIPDPYQKYVSIFRIAFMEANSVEAQSIFKIAKMQTDNVINLLHLEPGTLYQVWIEAYLTNGKVVKSDILDVMTKEGTYEIAESEGLKEEPRNKNAGGSYYGSMVTAVVFAVLFALALLAVSFLYLRRTTTYKAIISGGQSKLQKGASQQPGDSSGTSIPMNSQLNGHNTDHNGKKSEMTSSI